MSSLTYATKKLFIGSKSTAECLSHRITGFFVQLILLTRSVCETLSNTDKYVLIIPRNELDDLLDDPVCQFPQVHTIYVYHANNISYKKDWNRYQIRCPKLKFCHECDLPKELDKHFIDNIIDPSRSIDRTAVSNFASSVRERVSASRSSSAPAIEPIQMNTALSIPQSTGANDASIISYIELNINMHMEELHLLKQQIEDRKAATFDGTFVWKIRGVREEIAAALSQQRTSIYSPAFYSSPTGYKMCLRLYLNGDGDVQGEYLSLFFVLMPDKHDAILHWPFSYKITFDLIDQSTENPQQHNICKSFWPDLTSDCFKRPRLRINEGYGIKQFYPLRELEQNPDMYMKDDIMFIRTTIDFLHIRPASLGTNGTGSSAREQVRNIDSIDDLIGL